MVGGETCEKDEIVIKKRDARGQSNAKDREKGKEKRMRGEQRKGEATANESREEESKGEE